MMPAPRETLPEFIPAFYCPVIRWNMPGQAWKVANLGKSYGVKDV